MLYYRRVLQIKATDSPNVMRGLEQQQQGLEPDGLEVIPGVLGWRDYLVKLATYDPQRRAEGLDAVWYEGGELKLFPAIWLAVAVRRNAELRRLGTKRQAKAMGIDSGEGSANTSYAVIDELGLIELSSIRTPDTTDVIKYAKEIGKRHNIPPENWGFDRGGGGLQHAQYLRLQGYKVRTIASGAPPQLEPRRGLYQIKARRDIKEEQYAYLNVRVQMAHDLSQRLDPSLHGDNVFAIPSATAGPAYAELHRQLSVFPRQTDDRGRYTLPPKQKRDVTDKRRTLIDMLGRSPDEYDALANALHVLLHKPQTTAHAGVL